MADEVGAEPDDDGTLIAVRTVGADGRSRAHLGGRSVPVGVLGRLAEATLAVHGQNDQLRLLRPAEQRALLDRFAGDDGGRAVGAATGRCGPSGCGSRPSSSSVATAPAGSPRRPTCCATGSPRSPPSTRSRGRTSSSSPRPGGSRRPTSCGRSPPAAQAALVGAEDVPDAPAALALIGEARHRLAAAGDAELSALDARLAEALALLGDVGAELTGYLDRLDADPERLAAVLSRQAELKALTRKYAADVDGVLAWAAAARAAAGFAGRLRRGARRASPRGATGSPSSWPITPPPSPPRAPRPPPGSPPTPRPSWPGSRWPTPDCSSRSRSARPAPGPPTPCGSAAASWWPGPTGSTRSSCASSRTPAPSPQPLHKGASGGELSRVMLALEVALAGADPVPTMVFDEVDAGVGGRAAVEIGRRLARLAARHQVIVVTHLPQVAAYADRHLVVDKSRRDGGTARSRVRTLAEDERIVELARMLAGLDDTDTGRAHAEELLEAARSHRAADRTPTRRR